MRKKLIYRAFRKDRSEYDFFVLPCSNIQSGSRSNLSWCPLFPFWRDQFDSGISFECSTKREAFWIADFKNSNRFWIRHRFGLQRSILTLSTGPIWLWNYWNRYFCAYLSLKIQSYSWFFSDLGPKVVLLFSHLRGLICRTQKIWIKYWNKDFWTKIKLARRGFLGRHYSFFLV